MNMNKTKLWAIILLGLALMVVLMVGLACGPTEEPVPRSYSCAVYTEQGCAKFVVANGGEIEVQEGGTLDLQESVDFTLGADEKLLLDGDTTNQTQTAGTLDINVGTTTANVSGFDVSVTTDDGTASGTDVFAGKITMVQNDADGDAKGLTIIADATTNAAANSYEYGISYDCEENTAGACPDGILLTSSGAASGMTDAVDASAANIVNAINIGANLIMGTDDSLSVGAADDTVILDSNDSAGTYTCTDADANAECIFAGGGTGASTLGTTSSTSANIKTDGTGDSELVVPENSIGPDEVAAMHDVVILCGQADENGTIYYGPATAVFGGDGSASYAISSAACDALDNATEATADAPIMTNVAFKVTGLFCKQSGTLEAGEGVTLTVRSAEADTTPAISCVINAGETDCRSLTGSTTDIAAGATLAIKSVQTSDNADDDHWCKVFIAYK